MAKVSIIIPISRKRYLNRLFESLNNLQGEASLLTYIDGDVDLYQKARNLTRASKFNERLCVFRRKGITSDSNVVKRRQRIADIHNEIRGLTHDTDFVFLTEDDTLLPPDTLIRLQERYKDDSGIVSGMQVGRWGFKALGSWVLDDLDNPTHIKSTEKKEQEVDGTGLYCCLTRKEYYLQNDFKPFLDILGPDVDFGINLRKKGLRNELVALECLHMTPKRDIGLEQIDQVEFHKGENGWKLQRCV
jgi:hypothetical protein